MNAGLPKQLPASAFQNSAGEENAPDDTERNTGMYSDVHEDVSTGLPKQLPASTFQNSAGEENAPDNTERNTGMYSDVHENKSTGLPKQLPARRVLKPFGVYIHWPFCLSRCPYCDFYKEVKKDVPQDEIIDSYLQDLEYYHRFTQDKTVSSIFFGGGTPSLIKPQNIEKIINFIAKKWQIRKDVEISLEANPNSDRGNLFQELKTAGINRLSLGIQALNDKDLRFLGRTHNLKQAQKAIDEVINTFDNHSMDLIYARPKQSLNEWEEELKQATNFGFKHISLYQLTIEEGTVFAAKGIQALDDEAAVQMYAFTNDCLNANGYPQYEVSNYGLPCKHNLLYWEGDDYIGIGKSAHGRFMSEGKIYATTHHLNMEELTAQERAEELIIMGLRLNAGINKQRFFENCGLPFAKAANPQNLQNLISEGFLTETKNGIKATSKGFAVLNKIIEELCC